MIMRTMGGWEAMEGFKEATWYELMISRELVVISWRIPKIHCDGA
jgi:hypothetical protein